MHLHCMAPNLSLSLSPSFPPSLPSPTPLHPFHHLLRSLASQSLYSPAIPRGATFLPGGRDDWPRVFCHGAQGQACCLWQERRAQGEKAQQVASFVAPTRDFFTFFCAPLLRPCLLNPSPLLPVGIVAFSLSSACSLIPFSPVRLSIPLPRPSGPCSGSEGVPRLPLFFPQQHKIRAP